MSVLYEETNASNNDSLPIENNSTISTRTSYINRNMPNELKAILKIIGKICSQDVKNRIEHLIVQNTENISKFFDAIFELVFNPSYAKSIEAYAILIEYLIDQENHRTPPRNINELTQCLLQKLQDIFEFRSAFDPIIMNSKEKKRNFIWFLKDLIHLQVLVKKHQANFILILISNFFENIMQGECEEKCKLILELLAQLISLCFTQRGMSKIPTDLFNSLSQENFSVYEFHCMKLERENLYHYISKDIVKLLKTINDICNFNIVVKIIFTINYDYMITMEKRKQV